MYCGGFVFSLSLLGSRRLSNTMFSLVNSLASANSNARRGNTGGHSSAMDHVPTFLSYWNCQDLDAVVASNTTRLVEGGSEDLAEVEQQAQVEMHLFGGQSRCSECRCFVSSLVELSSGTFNPTFPSFGLCYRFNCYKQDYLQARVAGCWLLVAGCWLLVAGCWLLVAVAV